MPDALAATACANTLQPASAQWASGARLLGYQTSGPVQAGERLHIQLHWETTEGPLGEDVHWFHHLLDGQGRRRGQFDYVGWPAERWQPGDQVISYFDLTVDAEAGPSPYALRVGQYTYPALDNIPVVDEAGNPANYAVELPLDMPWPEDPTREASR
jgi:hypothetical protein